MMIMSFTDAAGGRLDWPRLKELLEQAPDSGGIPIAHINLFTEREGCVPLPAWMKTNVVKDTHYGNSVPTYHLTVGDDPYSQGLAGNPEKVTEEAARLLRGINGCLIEQHLLETFQIDSIEKRPWIRVDNTVYQYTATANLVHPECYDDVHWGELSPMFRSGSGNGPWDALVYLAEALHTHANHYLRSADAFQVPPYREYKPGGDWRCKRCGSVLTNERLFEGDKYKWLCSNTYCKYHDEPQY